jgi:hypothetical protein
MYKCLGAKSFSGGDIPASVSVSQSKSPIKKPQVLFSESFIHCSKQGGLETILGEGCDIVTRETCVPASLKGNNLGKAAVLHLQLERCQTQLVAYWAQLWLCQVLICFSESLPTVQWETACLLFWHLHESTCGWPRSWSQRASTLIIWFLRWFTLFFPMCQQLFSEAQGTQQA